MHLAFSVFPDGVGAAECAQKDVGEIVVREEVLGGELFQGGKVEHVKGAESLIVGVDGLVVGEVEDELEAEVIEKGLIEAGIIERFVGFNEW